MSTSENKNVTVIGGTAHVITGDVTEVIGTTSYTLNSPLSSTTYTMGNLYQSSDSRNIDVKGNSQEVCAGKGITCDWHLKVVGSPELFEATAQMAADRATAGFVSLLLQKGDDSNFASFDPLESINPMEAVSNVSSGLQTSFKPDFPPIRNLEDVPIALGKMQAWSGTVKMANAQEQLSRAAAFKIDREKRKAQRTVPNASDVNQLSSTPTVKKQMIFDEWGSSGDSLTANQGRLG